MDEYRPKISLLFGSFHAHLVDQKYKELQEQQRQVEYKRNRWQSSFSSGNNTTTTVVEIPWIETLLQTPIPDFRKYCMWHIICHIL
jgi:hypothetical protein